MLTKPLQLARSKRGELNLVFFLAVCALLAVSPVWGATLDAAPLAMGQLSAVAAPAQYEAALLWLQSATGSSSILDCGAGLSQALLPTCLNSGSICFADLEVGDCNLPIVSQHSTTAVAPTPALVLEYAAAPVIPLSLGNRAPALGYTPLSFHQAAFLSGARPHQFLE